ncbi:MAG: hypothetical protein OEZ02_14110 [Anaerolineae bacterium]|nr:hypothetical protein [Anaerolineae bacterium]
MQQKKRTLSLVYFSVLLIAVASGIYSFYNQDVIYFSGFALNLATELIGAFVIYIFVQLFLIGDEWDLAEQVRKLINPSMVLSQELQRYDLEFQNSQDIWILGITLGTTIKKNQSTLQRQVAQGASLRIILLKDEENLLNELSLRSENNNNPGHWKSEINNTRNRIKGITSHINKGGSVDLRCVPYIPSFGIILVNPKSKSGYCYVEMYHHKSTQTNPNFVIRKNENEKWFYYFVEQFTNVWHSCELLDLNET